MRGDDHIDDRLWVAMHYVEEPFAHSYQQAGQGVLVASVRTYSVRATHCGSKEPAHGWWNQPTDGWKLAHGC